MENTLENQTNTTNTYVPPQLLLEQYANVLVNYALGGGQGVKAGEVVMTMVPDIAKPLALELQKAILKAGAHPYTLLLPTGFDRSFYELANDAQLTFFPKDYLKKRVDLIDHQISVIADPLPDDLSNTDPKKIIKSRDAKKQYRDWLNKKEHRGKFTWTLGLWGVQAKADLVGMDLEEYWNQIIKACFLDKEDPVQEWKQVAALQEDIKRKLNTMPIDYVHVKGSNADIKVKIGPERQWCGGGGRNIPSFEIFTSPDWRGTQGWIRFNEPLYRYGQIIQNIYLQFNKGKVVEAKAAKGDRFLQEMLKSPNANKIGEFSLTDKRMSRITHPMAETLFDENMGGPFGNTHLAIGMAYKDCYKGNPAKLTKPEWRKLGFNDSAEHTDMVSTTDRTVTAYLADGTSQVIYQDGMFVI